MNAFTKMSGKGQVVVPNDVRQRLGWSPGVALEVLEGVDFVTLRRPRTKTLTVEQATARLRSIYQHQGPPIPIEQLGWTADGDDDLA